MNLLADRRVKIATYLLFIAWLPHATQGTDWAGEPQPVNYMNYKADVVAVIQVNRCVPVRSDDEFHVSHPGRVGRIDAEFEWVEVWRKTTLRAIPECAPTCRLCSGIGGGLQPFNAAGRYLAFLFYEHSGMYTGTVLKIEADGQLPYSTIWDMAPGVGPGVPRFRPVSLDQAKTLVRACTPADGPGRYTVHAMRKRLISWHWEADQTYQRIRFHTYDPPVESWPHVYYDFHAFVETRRFSEAARGALNAARQNLPENEECFPLIVSGKWLAGSFLVDQITEAETGVVLLEQQPRLPTSGCDQCRSAAPANRGRPPRQSRAGRWLENGDCPALEVRW